MRKIRIERRQSGHEPRGEGGIYVRELLRPPEKPGHGDRRQKRGYGRHRRRRRHGRQDPGDRREDTGDRRHGGPPRPKRLDRAAPPGNYTIRRTHGTTDPLCPPLLSSSPPHLTSPLSSSSVLLLTARGFQAGVDFTRGTKAQSDHAMTGRTSGASTGSISGKDALLRKKDRIQVR